MNLRNGNSNKQHRREDASFSFCARVVWTRKIHSTLHNFNVWHQLTYAIFKTFPPSLSLASSLWLVNCLNFVFSPCWCSREKVRKGIKAQECLQGVLSSASRESWISFFFSSDEICFSLFFSSELFHIREQIFITLRHERYDEMKWNLILNSQSFFPVFFLCGKKTFPESGEEEIAGRRWGGGGMMRRKNIVSSSPDSNVKSFPVP